ncbi:hypothetical protein [Escherichia coli]|uniref:hypothetical protein n=1 Tax=Escherichia coli TaxID=562 RepID=UPI00044BE5EC|nr:hypothetical protein [Escherichia coli]EER9146646.1 hypothetical protein [Escherichia coli]EEU2029548.1 hypothetical protein [Escherichia coli]EFE8774959.1 hypothetical protein [Escherichia coli]EFF7899079.1 hypothetical protein [Escherichia coli]EFG0190762.1 hypothetical protein [Escherichia coli]
MTYADGGKVHQLHTSLDCEGCKNHGWLVRSGWFTYPDIGDVQIRVLRLVDLLNSNLRFAEISAGKAKAQKRALEQYQPVTTVTVERGYYLPLCCESLLVTNK